MKYKVSKRFNLKRLKKMNKVKITYEKFLHMNANVKTVISAKKDKLAMSVNEYLIPGIQKIAKEYNDDRKIILRENALTGKDDEVLYEEKVNEDGSRDFKYSKEGLVAIEKSMTELLKKEVELEVYIVKDSKRALTLHRSVQELFNGILFQVEISALEDLYNEDEAEVKVLEPELVSE